MDTYNYNRKTGQTEKEIVLGDGMLRLAYSNAVGRVLFWPMFHTALFSRLMGCYANSGLSKGRISKTIESLGIDMDDFVVPEKGFTCFNDFFTRKVKEGARPFAAEGLCSPADCRLTVYPKLAEGTCIPVKGRSFTARELLGEPGKEYADCFNGGALAIFRLCPADYHRYHFPDSGRLLAHWRMRGAYHSVNPLALLRQIRVFTHNVREISILELEHYGISAFIEVGAFGVATIRQTFQGNSFQRGDEKGYFAFGGSTIIMLFQQGKVIFDEDLTKNLPLESLVRAGEHIAS
ncbi:MAG: phosphatidylserine decarboxylase [Victivallales bacterium]|nr:phosphatidylserine decarboxylase [Victivallales bacterium]